MTATDWALVLVWVAAVPITIFVVLYGLTNHWWLSWVGRALFVSSFALALLLNLSLLNYYRPHTLTPIESNIVIGVVALGAWLKLFALLLDKLPRSRVRFSRGRR